MTDTMVGFSGIHPWQAFMPLSQQFPIENVSNENSAQSTMFMGATVSIDNDLSWPLDTASVQIDDGNSFQNDIPQPHAQVIQGTHA